MCRAVTLVFVLSILAAGSASNAALAHLGVANQLFEQERFEEAAAEYAKALDTDPKLIAARRGLAVCRFELRQYESAHPLLLELLKQPLTSSLAHYYLGRISLAEGHFSAAMAQFLAIPRTHAFRDEQYYLGMAYFKAGDWPRSEKTLQGAIRDNPRDFRSHQLLARALQKLGRKNAAALQFSETRRLLNDYTEGSETVKRCGQLWSSEAADADRVCRQLLETDDVDQLAAVGTLLGKAGLFAQAATAWKRAALLDPESPEIRYDLALTCFRLKDRACARDNAKAAIEAREDFPEANVLYASVLYMMGADAECLPALRKAHSLLPGDASVRELLSRELVLWAEHYAKTGQRGDARALLTELGTLQPLQPEVEQHQLAVQRLLAEERQ